MGLIFGQNRDVRVGKKTVEMDCECDCCSIKVEAFDENVAGITFQTNYLGRQNGCIKRAFKALIGKETCYAEAINYKKDVIHFLEETLKMLKAPAPNKFDLKIESTIKDKEEVKLLERNKVVK